MVLFRPSSSSTLGSHPRTSRARVISGRRCLGSSAGSGLKMISDPEHVDVNAYPFLQVYIVSCFRDVAKYSLIFLRLSTSQDFP